MNKIYQKLVKRLKKDLKNQEQYEEKCKEYQEDKDFIDSVEIFFAPMDVSAKTVNGTIILNENLLEGEWDEIQRYIIHELTHVLQQINGLVDGPIEKGKYLDDENEQEAFRIQLDYMSDHDTPEEIQEYLENLLDHHNIKGKKRQEYIKELTKDID